MREQLRKLFSDSVIYGVSGIISSFINIFLIPLYTKVFTPHDYGIISLMLTTSAILTVFIMFAMDSATTVWFWDLPEKQDRKVTFTTWNVFLMVGGFIGFILLAVLCKPLSRFFFGTSGYALLFILLGCNICFVGFQKAVNIWCRMLRKPFMAMGYSITLLLLTIASNIVLVLYYKVGIKGVFISQAISSVLGFILLLWLFREWIDLKLFDRKRLKDMLRFGTPLVPATLTFWLMNSASTYFLKFFVKDNAQIGLFQVGSSIANVLALFTWGFFQAWSPFALSVAKQDNAKDIYKLVMEAFCVLGIFVALALLLMGEDILRLFTNEEYIGARHVVGLLAINIILQGIPNILAIANYLSKSNNSYAVAIAIGCAISVAGFIFLIPLWGKEGAAIAMVLGNLFVSVFLAVKVKKLYHVPYRYDRIIGLVLVEASLFIAAKYIVHGLLLHVLVTFGIGALLVLYYVRQYKPVLQRAFLKPRFHK